ncbi:hypothetical protein NDU88_002816 [Pleurodeles waltl]|uniref:Uncharacterized protein n=1 Tax=Pleurodeles waltl TaxID=8319 RepID=A0AAV7W0E7_PLEWA|nr:hypothetical protein NDU88_002816 [Pleurodeles waltl]
MAIGWMGFRVLWATMRIRDVLKWEVVKEQHLQLSRSDEKAAEDMASWRLILDDFNEHEDSDTDTGQGEQETLVRT